MKSIKQTLENKNGLHARPAALFVNEAQKYESEITIDFEQKSANAKSLLSILGLGVGYNNIITIKADGPDEQLALNNLVKLLESNIE
jgi:phosphocarrier protein